MERIDNQRRRIGILNNELYLGQILYNRQRFLKDPEAGKRIARPNPEHEWVTREVILQRLCGTACHLISAVLRCSDLGVGLDCLVCTKLRGSVRGAQRFNRQRCWPCSQHRDKCVGDVAGLVQRESVGFTVVLVLLLLGGLYELSQRLFDERR
jgi:hypothetical protein